MDGCARPHDARGYCPVHYQRWRKYGDPLGGGPYYGAPLAFLRDVAANLTDDCILWPFCKNNRGYGEVRFEGRNRSASRIALILATGQDPEDMETAHGPCHNFSCVNPRHLSWETPAENQADRLRDGTSNRGERHGMKKLSAQQIFAIRADSRAQHVIAEDYDVHQTTISKIKRRRRWGWLA